MKGISLNITAVVLYIVGAFIISGSNIWVIVSPEYPVHNVTIAASNLASVFSMGVGCILTQVDIWNKHNELKTLKTESGIYV